MRTEQIHYLKEVAETKSLNKASQNLCISIQALSTSIKKLENEIGYKLLSNTHSGSYLTDKGEKFLEIGLEFLEKVKTLGTQDTTIKDYSFLCIPGVVENILADFLISEAKKPSANKLAPLVLRYEECFAELLKRNYEFFLATDSYLDDRSIRGFDEQLVFFPLLLLPSQVLINNKNPLVKNKSIDFRDLAGYNLLLLEYAPGDYSDADQVYKTLFENITITHVRYPVLYEKFLREKNTFAMATRNRVNSDDIKCIDLTGKNFCCYFGYIKLKNTILSKESEAFLHHMLTSF